jgi:hypothetical protein
MFEILKNKEELIKLNAKLDLINGKLNELLKVIREEKKASRNTQNQAN